MKLKNLIIASIAIAGVLAASSCKKDNAADNGIDKSLLDGQWKCTVILKNNGPVYSDPYILWDIDAASNKATIYFYDYEDGDQITEGSFDLTDSQFILKKGSTNINYKINYFDQKHIALEETIGKDKYEYRLTNMNAILVGKWEFTWKIGENNYSSQYYRLDEDGTGVRLTEEGAEGSIKIKWWVEPAKDDYFRFTFSIPGTNPLYENTITIDEVDSDDSLYGEDESDTYFYLTRMKNSIK